VATSAVPTSATGKIAACGLEHIDAPHLQRKKQVDYELTTSSRSRAVSTVKAAIASSRPASSQTRGWHRERARPTTSRSRKVWGATEWTMPIAVFLTPVSCKPECLR
jgi:hypothetical protein